MRGKVKKKSTLKQAAKVISDNIWAFLKTLPPEERNKRLEKFHKSVQKKLSRTKVKASYANTHQKLREPDCNSPTRLVARSGK